MNGGGMEHPFMAPTKHAKPKSRRTKLASHGGPTKDGIGKSSGAGTGQKKPRKKNASNKLRQNGSLVNGDAMSAQDSVESQRYNLQNFENGQLIFSQADLNALDKLPLPCVMTQSMRDEHSMNFPGGQYHSKPGMDPSVMEGHRDWLDTRGPLSQQSQGTPLSHGNLHSPPSHLSQHKSPMMLNGVAGSPVKPKNYPTSPTHMQAMHQHAQQNQRVQLSPPNEYTPFPDAHMEPSIPLNPMYTQDIHQQQKQHLGTSPLGHQMSMVAEQYPTPPSQHSHYSSESPPQHILATTLPEHYLTPSPDSPGQWSSSSPHSATSDWSEGISSPVQPIGQPMQIPMKKHEGIYL